MEIALAILATLALIAAVYGLDHLIGPYVLEFVDGDDAVLVLLFRRFPVRRYRYDRIAAVERATLQRWAEASFATRWGNGRLRSMVMLTMRSGWIVTLSGPADPDGFVARVAGRLDPAARLLIEDDSLHPTAYRRRSPRTG